MVHCDTMDMGAASQPSYDSGAALGALIARNRENSFRKKIGKMLADGDCQGAARFALEKGRLELGAEIARSCKPPTQSASRGSQLTVDPNQLESTLRHVAANAKTPMMLDDVTTVSKVEAIGNQLLLSAIVDVDGKKISDADRSKVTNDICAYESSPTLLRAGASIRIVYFERGGREIGAVMATRQECGF